LPMPSASFTPTATQDTSVSIVLGF
jgi:hypothetical protein